MEAFIKDVLTHARKLGAADAEVAYGESVALSVDVANAEVETLTLTESIGAGVRLFTNDRRMGFAYTTDLAGGAARITDQAWQNAEANAPDEHNVLLDNDAESEADWSQEDFAGIPVKDKVAFAMDLEARTLDAHQHVARVHEASYGESRYALTLANSRGLWRVFRNAHCSCSVVAIAERNGDQESGWEFDFGTQFSALRPDWVAASCANDAVRKLGGTPCAGRAMPIVLDNYVATQFLEVIAHTLLAENVLKGKSLFANRLGDRIASEAVTLVDQNDLEGAMNRAPFDGEGASAQETCAVTGGVLQSFLHNAYTADKMGTQTTANAGRSGFRSTPEVSVTNFFLQPDEATQEGLLEQAGEGLFVTEAMGVHTADPISGDFSFGASGLAIEGGSAGRAVRGVTIAGNVKNLLENVVAAGNDLRFFGACGAPSVWVSQLMVSGE